MDTATAATVNMDVVKAETSELEEVAKERRWEGGCLVCCISQWLFGFGVSLTSASSATEGSGPRATGQAISGGRA